MQEANQWDPDDEDMTYERVQDRHDLRPYPDQVNARITALEATVNRLTDEVEYLRNKVDPKP